MADYKHGAYGQVQIVGSRVAVSSQNAIVYVGTAPVHTVAGGAAAVNKPILIYNIAEARKVLGYSDNWADFTLCEAMYAHFENNAVGPLIFINVLDPAVHKSENSVTKSLTPANGRIVIAGAELAILDSVSVATKTKGTDYTVSYNDSKGTITISETTPGSLGASALSVSYDEVDPSAVTTADVIGSSDGTGLNTGIHAIKNVYQFTQYIPSFLLVPGFSSIPDVHNAMVQQSSKINGHWDCYMLADIPITSDGAAVTLATAAAWKTAHGYNQPNETVYFPMASGVDGKKYHISVLAAANMQLLLADQDGIPYRTASNTACAVIENLYLGESSVGRVYDDTTINNLLNKNGIASAAFVGGRWAIWGAHSADYGPDNADSVNVAETNRMMLYYISNDFQNRRSADVDKPLTMNDLQSIAAEEQARLDALLKIGALLYGEIHLNAEQDPNSDILAGDFGFTFNVTTTPLAKSLTATVNWTPEGFVTYFETFREQ